VRKIFALFLASFVCLLSGQSATSPQPKPGFADPYRSDIDKSPAGENGSGKRGQVMLRADGR